MMTYRTRRKVFGLGLLAPAAIVLAVVVAYPLVDAIRLSFFHVTLGATSNDFVGLTNYWTLLTGPALGPIFRTSLINTIAFAAGSTAAATAIGLAIALLLNERIAGRSIWRSLVIIPWAVPWVAASLLFLWILDPTWGVVDQVLVGSGILRKPVEWFGSPSTAMVALVILNAWKLSPFMALSFLASLQSRPQELVDAARIDGARALAVFWNVTVPHLRPVLANTTLVAIVWGFQAFTPIWLLTKGGPEYSTTTLSVLLYKKAFYDFDFGVATALGVVWLIVLLLVGVLWLRVLWRSE